MKAIKIFFIIVLLISVISFVGCCEVTQALGKMIDNKEGTDVESSEIQSVETSAEEKTAESSIVEVTTAAETSSAEVTAVAETTDTADTTTNESDTNLIHGVIPTKVTINTDYTSGALSANYYFEFWNVGKFGGDYYSDANLTMTLLKVPEGADMSDPVDTWVGYFTGGPNGELYLTDTDDDDVEKEYRCYLKNGKELITPSGMIFNIDNPEAFNGWVD
jgi:hypothetical protein